MTLAGTASVIARSAVPAIALIGFLAQPVPAQDVAPGLPGGASSLTEGHGDWTVAGQAVPAITGREAGKACVLSQRQVNAQGQTVFAVELRPAGEGGATGLMILPFGVAVREGVGLSVDGAAIGESLAFSTCLPAGCLVPVTFGAEAVAALAGGKAGTITAPAAEGAPVELTLSLNGFSGALARVAALGAGGS